MRISLTDSYNSYMEFLSRLSERNESSENNMGKNLSLHELRANGTLPQLDKNDWQSQFESIEPNSINKPQETYTGYNAENFESVLKNLIKDTMRETGIGFQDIEELQIGLNKDGQMTVSGLKSDADNQKLADALNHMVSTMSPLSGSNKVLSVSPETPGAITRLQAYVQRMFYRNSDYAMSATNEFERDNRATLIYLKNNAAKLTKDYTGIELDFSQLFRTEDGKIAGYPNELAWYFEANISKPDINNPSQTTKDEGYALAIRHFANALLDAGYNNIPSADNLNVVFKFNKSDFIGFNALV